MRIRPILIIAALSLGTMAAFEEAGTASQTSPSNVFYAQAGTLTGAVAVVRKSEAHLSNDPGTQTWSEPAPDDQEVPRLRVGAVLPEGAALYTVPRHESYRYAVVQGQRVIVDATSRQIVYIIQ
jgi:hypothetical protein